MSLYTQELRISFVLLTIIIECYYYHRIYSTRASRSNTGTLRPGGKEAKQLAVQRIVSVRKDTETQCRIVFGSLDEKRKKSKRAHRPYELLFDSPNELKRFLHSLQVVRESAPKRGMSVMKMERLGSFMNLENSVFGMWYSSAKCENFNHIPQILTNNTVSLFRITVHWRVTNILCITQKWL